MDLGRYLSVGPGLERAHDLTHLAVQVVEALLLTDPVHESYANSDPWRFDDVTHSDPLPDARALEPPYHLASVPMRPALSMLQGRATH